MIILDDLLRDGGYFVVSVSSYIKENNKPARKELINNLLDLANSGEKTELCLASLISSSIRVNDYSLSCDEQGNFVYYFDIASCE